MQNFIITITILHNIVKVGEKYNYYTKVALKILILWISKTTFPALASEMAWQKIVYTSSYLHRRTKIYFVMMLCVTRRFFQNVVSKLITSNHSHTHIISSQRAFKYNNIYRYICAVQWGVCEFVNSFEYLNFISIKNMTAELAALRIFITIIIFL